MQIIGQTIKVQATILGQIANLQGVVRPYQDKKLVRVTIGDDKGRIVPKYVVATCLAKKRAYRWHH